MTFGDNDKLVDENVSQADPSDLQDMTDPIKETATDSNYIDTKRLVEMYVYQEKNMRLTLVYLLNSHFIV